MPTYEYKCEACEHAWEAFQSMKDDALKECPSCHEEKARRQISMGTGFIMKGGASSQPSSIAPATPMSQTEQAFRERFEKVSGIPSTGNND